MPILPLTLKQIIRDALPDAHVELTPLADDNDHFQALIRSSHFEGKSRIQQHQMVYAALGPKMGNELHALSLKTEVLMKTIKE